jgi:hypothetical protein
MPPDDRDAPNPEPEATRTKPWATPRVIVSEGVARGVSKIDHSSVEKHYTTSFTDS